MAALKEVAARDVTLATFDISPDVLDEVAAGVVAEVPGTVGPVLDGQQTLVVVAVAKIGAVGTFEPGDGDVYGAAGAAHERHVREAADDGDVGKPVEHLPGEVGLVDAVDDGLRQDDDRGLPADGGPDGSVACAARGVGNPDPRHR